MPSITDTTGYPPRPSDACMRILYGRGNDSKARAEFDAAYRAEIIAAGFDPDFRSHQPATRTDESSRGQGKDYALPRGDRD
ncbi:hypothetical protein ACLBWP_03515 [Microbacterium sp. M1A1_1b]